METLSLIIEPLRDNALAAYGALVGTIALILNFMRYRHALSSLKIRLKVEIIEKMSQPDFIKFLAEHKDNGYRGSIESAITHSVKIRNLSNVTAHIENVWIKTKDGNEIKALKRANERELLYMAVSDLGGNLEIKPRSSVSLSLLSYENSGFLKPEIAFATDETGKRWRSKNSNW